MKKNLLDKMMSRHNKEIETGTWLYSADGVQGYVTIDGEFIDFRKRGVNDDK